MTAPTRLPFDQYQRYRLVAEIADRLRRATGKARRSMEVLDVGGRTGLLRQFLRRDRVTAVDLEPVEGTERLVLGDGARLPFQDDAFELVCAFDTLEHVPPPLRDAFVDECLRVSRGWVVLAGPYDAPRVRRAEELLKRFLRDKLAFHHRYLEEHRTNGLPIRADVEERMAGAGWEVRSLGHGNVERWLALLALSMYFDRDPGLSRLAPAVFEYYNRHLYAHDTAEPVYRHAVVAAAPDVPLPDLAGIPAGDGVESPAQSLGEVLLGLFDFDQAKGDWTEERERYRKAVEDLEGDLVGHRESLREARAEASEQAEVAETLRRDLSQHRDVLAEAKKELHALQLVERELRRDAEQTRAHGEQLEAELRSVRAELETLQRELADERERSAETVATLRGDLEGHRARLAEAEAHAREADASLVVMNEDLDGHRRTLEEVRSERDALRAERDALAEDLAGHRGVLAAARETSAALEVEREALAEDLRGHREVLEQARAVKAELAAERDTIAADLEGHRAALADTRAQLGASAAENAKLGAERAALESDLERLLGENELLRRERDDLARQIDEHRGVLEDRERRLGEHADVLADRERRLEEFEAVVADLRARVGESAQG